MKTIFTTIAIIICQMSFAQFGTRVQAFDAAIHISGGVRSGQDLTTSIAIGISGRRLPLSFFVGGNIMEFDNDYINMGLTHPSTWGINATAMARITHIDFRSMDFNVYSTIYKQPKIFMEYGCKTGHACKRQNAPLFAHRLFNRQGAGQKRKLSFGGYRRKHFTFLFQRVQRLLTL
jgi:hypothetical protein